MQNSPTAAYLHELSIHERLLLVALLRCIKRECVKDIKWDDLGHQHCVYIGLLAGEDVPVRQPAPGELVVLDTLVASHALLYSEGAAGTRRPEDVRCVVLNLEHTEVERVLGEVSSGPRAMEEYAERLTSCRSARSSCSRKASQSRRLSLQYAYISSNSWPRSSVCSSLIAYNPP
ncbi:hypothetical protein DAEQUDRAFT_602481 [Daedalea quercina L-15889]|uniref:Uncharacterized protein n=1 Tax=Daedalea quercina L-15889 TaxID=1314783 RepID=A0A165LLG9_9APHY|nr:hypothetical protein DAEQUDRAFT_602481 [Daedalea quercina L-15889]